MTVLDETLMNNAQRGLRMRPDGIRFRALLVLALLIAAPASIAQTLDPTLPRVSPSEQEFNSILRSQREQGRRALDSDQLRFELNAIRSRDLFDRSMPPVPPPPCRSGDHGC